MHETYSKGLEGIIATESSICQIDGVRGLLYYRGYPITDLTARFSFEEIAYLLFFGELPSDNQKKDFIQHLKRARHLSPELTSYITSVPKSLHPMEALQAIVPTLREEESQSENWHHTLDLVAKVPVIVAYLYRLYAGFPIIPADESLSLGSNFLYMLHGKEVSEIEEQAIDQCFSLHAEHGLNASTFTARVTASTLAPCHSAVSAALGSLFGSLHGGANEHVMNMLDEIENVNRVDEWIDKKMDAKEKIMGMGHRVYKVKDPRAVRIEIFLKKLSQERGDTTYYTMLSRIEERVRFHMNNKPVYANVDFFSGSLYRILGIPNNFFTPIFAAARTIGWVTHINEQQKNNKLYRPGSLYIGSKPRTIPR